MAIDEQELIEEVQTEVDELSEEELQAEAQKLLLQRAKRKTYSQKKTPEQIEKQKLYRKKKYERDKLILAKAKELPNYAELEQEAEQEVEEMLEG